MFTNRGSRSKSSSNRTDTVTDIQKLFTRCTRCTPSVSWIYNSNRGNWWVAVGWLISKQARGKICYVKITAEWQKNNIRRTTVHITEINSDFFAYINLCIFMSLYRKLFACCLLMPAARIHFRPLPYFSLSFFLIFFCCFNIYSTIPEEEVLGTLFKICRGNYLNWKLFV